MTRLVVTTDAEADLNEIIDYLKQEATAVVAEEYGRKFRLCIERLVEVSWHMFAPARAWSKRAHWHRATLHSRLRLCRR